MFIFFPNRKIYVKYILGKQQEFQIRTLYQRKSKISFINVDMIYKIYQFETPLTYLVQIFCQETWPLLIAYLGQVQRGEFR